MSPKVKEVLVTVAIVTATTYAIFHIPALKKVVVD